MLTHEAYDILLLSKKWCRSKEEAYVCEDKYPKIKSENGGFLHFFHFKLTYLDLLDYV